jgi:hypothetical protein
MTKEGSAISDKSVPRECPMTKEGSAISDSAGDRRGLLGRSRLRRASLLAAAAASVALLAAGCGGGRSAAPPGAHPGQRTAQQVDSFALCVRDHGLPGFYVSRWNGPASDYNGPGLWLGGWYSTAINPGSPVLQSALNACRHMLGIHGIPEVTPAELRGAVKVAACMRAHGYPDYPDPTEQNGQITWPLPASIDTSSPQFQSAQRACH